MSLEKEKAMELVDVFGKKLSKKVVKEIIYYLEIVLGVDKTEFEFWYEVKKELKNLTKTNQGCKNPF
jgi:hypothetical protein